MVTMRGVRCGIFAGALLGAVALAGGVQAAEGPRVAAASHLQPALDAAADRFVARGGLPPKISYASSGNLRWRIARGEPFELFLSADEGYVLELFREGRTEDRGVIYAEGRLALVAPPGSPVEAAAGLEGLRAALERGEVRRFAVADPGPAPYGAAARDALERARLWEAVEPHLVFGENASRAARSALSPRYDGGLVAWPLLAGSRWLDMVQYQVLPREAHAPIRQRMALLHGAGEDARDFYRFLLSERGREILALYEFDLP